MEPIGILDVFNYALTVVFGMPLMVLLAGGFKARRDWIVFFLMCSVLLTFQTYSLLTWGWYTTRQLYPLIMHLPILLGLVFGMKKPVGISLVSVCAGVLCCRFPRHAGIVVAAVTRSALAEEIAYIVITVLLFPLLLRYFVPSARDTMAESPKTLLFFGSLPVIYYIYDFAIISRSQFLSFEILPFDPDYSDVQIIREIIPSVVGMLYLAYTTAYRQQLRQRTQAELQNSLLEGQLRQAEAEMASLRQAEALAATYQHDMRHHLAAINAFLEADKPQQAEKYIRQVQAGIEAITPKRFCENELVNLLCSSFSARAERMGARLTLEAALPGSLAIPDTALCALLSNGLENALNAVGELEEDRRWVELYCGVRLDKLLIEIRNPCAGQIPFRDGLPETARSNHGYGCLSIRTIAQRHRGLCEFKEENGVFTLRVALPM